MGTFGSDTVYQGLAKFSPPTHPLQSAAIDARWVEWRPFATMESRHHSDPANKLYAHKIRHRARLIDLLRARISWETIRAKRLDDPRMPAAAFEFSLRAAAERRRVRMGRIKGKRRGKNVT